MSLSPSGGLPLDACVAGSVRNALTQAGNDGAWVREWNPRATDEEVLGLTAREGRILVTLDKDFGELAVGRRQPHVGIIRLVGWRAGQQAQALPMVLERYGPELKPGAIYHRRAGRGSNPPGGAPVRQEGGRLKAAFYHGRAR